MELNEFLNAARVGKNGFWRYFLVTLLVVGAMLFASTVLVIILFLAENTQRLEDLNFNSTLILSMLPFLFAALTLFAGLALFHRRGPRSIIFPAGRFRWSAMFISGGVWLLLAGVSDAITYLIDPGRYTWNFRPELFFPFLALALVLIPIQTSTEELFFRGYLTQGVGLLAKGNTLIALIVPSVLFGLLHSWNPEVIEHGLLWMLPQYIGMGLLLGYVTLRSRGLELALGLHAANNLYSALLVTFTESAIPSPALFTMNVFDPKLGLVLLFLVYIPLYLLAITAWKGGKLWKLAGAVVALSLLLGACVPVPQSASADYGIPLEDCRLSMSGLPTQVNARCGTVEVFEDRAANAGRKIALKVAVLPATSQNNAGDPLFLLAGGPGQAATEAFVPILSSLDRVNFKRDIVLVDQRGTGASNPLRCPQVEGDLLDTDISTEEQQAQLQACLSSLDADPSLYTTDIAMQDLDQVRAALGYDQINVLGVSYGTRAALMYLRLFPEHVRAIILDSVVPYDWSLGEWVARDAQRAFDLTVTRCQEDEACRAAFPDSGAQFDALLEKLDAEPQEVSLPNPTTGQPDTITLTRAAAGLTVRMMLYSSEYTALVPLVIDQAAAGDWTPLAAQYMLTFQSLDESIADGMYMSVLCSEDAPFYGSQAAEMANNFSIEVSAIQQQCELWPHKIQPDELRGPVQSDVPALLMSGEADPVTPPEYAAQVAQSLPNSRQIVLSGMGHNVMYRGCMPRVINDFLESGSAAGLDVSCAENIQPDPFFVNFSGPKP